MAKKLTLKNLKIWWKWIPRSLMNNEQLELFNEHMKKHRDETIRLEQLFKQLIINRKEDIIILPMYLPIRKVTVPDTKIAMNLNGYRNWSFILSNEYKITYKELIWEQLIWKKILEPTMIEYKIFREKKPDWMNIASVASKFFLDSLIEFKVIEDDNVDIITWERWINGWKTNNPRIEVMLYKTETISFNH